MFRLGEFAGKVDVTEKSRRKMLAMNPQLHPSVQAAAPKRVDPSTRKILILRGIASRKASRCGDPCSTHSRSIADAHGCAPGVRATSHAGIALSRKSWARSAPRASPSLSLHLSQRRGRLATPVDVHFFENVVNVIFDGGDLDPQRARNFFVR